MAAVDCTGHGVPGAFMSMIGDSLLSQIIHDKEILEADEILNKMNQGINVILNQSATENRDGMDIALVIIDHKGKEIQFAGAHSPLVYIQNKKLYEVKGDKFGIGGYTHSKLAKDRTFKKQTIKIDKPTAFYIFSDGYQDQFGGPQKRKFMVKNLKSMLLDIHTSKPEDQKKHLSKKLEEWIDGYKQIDDILVVGAKIG